MVDHNVDLEEAVGSYLNCLSTSCAAGSKLYTSVGKIVDNKFQELFPSQETKLLFQTLQTQNAFEGYQKALLECKDKLLEILSDSHTKRQPAKDKNRQGKSKSTEEVTVFFTLFVKEIADLTLTTIFSNIFPSQSFVLFNCISFSPFGVIYMHV